MCVNKKIFFDNDNMKEIIVSSRCSVASLIFFYASLTLVAAAPLLRVCPDSDPYIGAPLLICSLTESAAAIASASAGATCVRFAVRRGMYSCETRSRFRRIFSPVLRKFQLTLFMREKGEKFK